MAKDPQTIASEWSSRLAQSSEKIKRGIESVTVAPGQAAARQKSAYLAGVQARVDTWARRVASVPLADWQAAMETKGLPRIASGASAAEGKFAAFMSELLPFIQSGRSALPARGNLEANIGRMTQFVRHMAKFQRRGG